MDFHRLLPTSLAAAILVSGTGWAQLTTRASVDSSEAQGIGGSALPAISSNGRFVAFHAAATNLVAGDTNGVFDVFVRDLVLGTTERVSLGAGGAQANALSGFPAISDDGRFVAFESDATNLVAGDTNGVRDIFLRDRQTGTTTRMSVDTAGVEGNNTSNYCAISGDGNHVAFLTAASNLVPGDTNLFLDTLVRDRPAGVTVRVNVDSIGTQANGSCFPFGPSALSTNGRYVAFSSSASNHVPGDGNGTGDVFVHDRQTGMTERVSYGPGGIDPNNVSYWATISGDGRYVAYLSNASNLIVGDLNGWGDIFVRDRLTGANQLVSVATGGGQGNASSLDPAISSDGRFVAFYTDASNLVPGDVNGFYDIFVHDRQTGVTQCMSVDTAGVPGNGESGYPKISGDGRFSAFAGAASNLVAGDTNGVYDVFARDRVLSGFISTCDPGTGGVIACPCANPPSGPGRGCNNSSGTGGAILSASGVAYLATDTLVFTTSGEKPSALSLLAQWLGGNSTGVVFGMGVRCTSSTFKRLFSKNAVGGSITVPDFGAGDPTVSARSAAKGDTILPGQSRWYLVYYRDNTVLGGCPVTSNFNSTQTGRVTWMP